MLNGYTVGVATQYRLTGFSEGQNVATEYRWAGRQHTGRFAVVAGRSLNHFLSASLQAKC